MRPAPNTGSKIDRRILFLRNRTSIFFHQSILFPQIKTGVMRSASSWGKQSLFYHFAIERELDCAPPVFLNGQP